MTIAFDGHIYAFDSDRKVACHLLKYVEYILRGREAFNLIRFSDLCVPI